MVFWYEVNEAWSEASLVWLSSFIKSVKRGGADLVELKIWCDVAKGSEWLEGYIWRISQVIGSVIGYEVYEFSSEDSDLGIDTTGRCIDSGSVKIAVSRVLHYNEMIDGAGEYDVLSSVPTSYEELAMKSVPKILVHCDIDGIFTEWFDVEEFMNEVMEECHVPCIAGVNEHDDIRGALSSSHSKGFMEKIGGVYLNAGFLVFYGIRHIDVYEMLEYLKGGDAYCLEQDYLNVSYDKVSLSSDYNVTYRKVSHSLAEGKPLLPRFIHYYGENKPFLPKPYAYDPESYYYFPEYYEEVKGIRGILSEGFVRLCRERNRDYWIQEGV